MPKKMKVKDERRSLLRSSHFVKLCNQTFDPDALPDWISVISNIFESAYYVRNSLAYFKQECTEWL